jgi:hypothetical protein
MLILINSKLTVGQSADQVATPSELKKGSEIKRLLCPVSPSGYLPGGPALSTKATRRRMELIHVPSYLFISKSKWERKEQSPSKRQRLDEEIASTSELDITSDVIACFSWTNRLVLTFFGNFYKIKIV